MSASPLPAPNTLLWELEMRIQAGINTFREVGEALARIREERLYLATHTSFADYCRERWAMSKPRATQLIHAASAVQAIAEVTAVTPATEAQTRPLAALPPAEKAEAWKEAQRRTGKAQPPAQAVLEVVVEKQGGKLPKYAPSSGMQFAHMAIAQLERIHIKDTERAEAFAKVRNWIAEQQKPHGKRASYEQWEEFRVTCERIAAEIEALQKLRVLAQFSGRARDVSGQLGKRLLKLSNQL